MLRRFLILGVGALALLAVLGAPGQVHAQRMRGFAFRGMTPGFRGGFTPGFRGLFRPGFRRGMFNRPFTPLFRGGRFTPGFPGGTFSRSFNFRFNNGLFFDPRFNRGFRPGMFRPF